MHHEQTAAITSEWSLTTSSPDWPCEVLKCGVKRQCGITPCKANTHVSGLHTQAKRLARFFFFFFFFGGGGLVQVGVLVTSTFPRDSPWKGKRVARSPMFQHTKLHDTGGDFLWKTVIRIDLLCGQQFELFCFFFFFCQLFFYSP